MFIPNKTYHAMQTVIVGVIAVLVMVIAGQSVLYIKTANENKMTLDSLTTQVNSLTDETRGDFRTTNTRQSNADEQLANLNIAVAQLQSGLSVTQTSVDKLLRNECTPETSIYVLTKDMVAVCRTLGVLP